MTKKGGVRGCALWDAEPEKGDRKDRLEGNSETESGRASVEDAFYWGKRLGKEKKGSSETLHSRTRDQRIYLKK